MCHEGDVFTQLLVQRINVFDLIIVRAKRKLQHFYPVLPEK